MNKLLLVVPCCKNDSARCEQLLDLIYHLDGRQTKGHCLLIFAPDVHPEMKAKLRISAANTFVTTDVYDGVELRGTAKHEMTLSMFRSACEQVNMNYIWPWLWLEPDCLPLAPNWRETLSEAYESQPRRYMGLHLMSNNVTFLSRCSIYPANCYQDLISTIELQTPFEAALVSRSTKSQTLFQHMVVNDVSDVEKIKPGAVLLHHDKRGLLLDWAREKTASVFNAALGSPTPDLPEIVGKVLAACTEARFNGDTPKRPRGRPPKVQTPLQTV